jgi:hypothetical protein
MSNQVEVAVEVGGKGWMEGCRPLLSLFPQRTKIDGGLPSSEMMLMKKKV